MNAANRPAAGPARLALSLVVAAILASLAACGPSRDGAGNGTDAATAAPLAGARIGGPFALTDQNGKTVTWDDFAGKYRIVYFGYTYCPDICPVDLQNIMAGFRKFEKAAPDRAAKVQPIFITVDPARDTVSVLKTYVAAFHPRLIGLTGTPAAIEKVKTEFAVVASREGKGDTTDYLVSHSRTPYLFGPDGKPIALIPVDAPGEGPEQGGPDAVAKFLGQWVK